MWKSLVALVVALMLPLSAFAQNQPATATAADDNGGLGKTIAMTVGVVGGVVVADLLTGGSLTGPLLRTVGLRPALPAGTVARAAISPAVAEARAAGAVLGEQITGATEARDMAARADRVYAAILGLGGIAGGWLVSHFSH